MPDKRLLQREAKDGSSPVLSLLAYGPCGSIALGLLGAMAWGLGRLSQSGRASRARPRWARPALRPRGRLSAS